MDNPIPQNDYVSRNWIFHKSQINHRSSSPPRRHIFSAVTKNIPDITNSSCRSRVRASSPSMAAASSPPFLSVAPPALHQGIAVVNSNHYSAMSFQSTCRFLPSVQSASPPAPTPSPVIPSTSLSPDVSLQYKAALICHRRLHRHPCSSSSCSSPSSIL